MKKYILGFSLFFALNNIILQGQTITNINPSQRTDGSITVDIYYDLSGPEPVYDVLAETSFDGGINFIVIDSMSGDVGTGVSIGTGKQIIWRFGNEFPGQYTSQAQIKLTVLVSTALCGSPLLDERDGKSYNTIKIGTQCWMAENLNIGTMVQGTTNQLENGIIEKYCSGNNAANCDVFGGLYQWSEMMQYSSIPGGQGICPSGWHIPTDVEWCLLEQAVDPTITCSSTGWRGIDGGTNLKQGGSSGFEGLLGGTRYIDGTFPSFGIQGSFWSSTLSGPNASYRGLINSNSKVLRDFYGVSNGFSLRCVKDSPSTWGCGQPLSISHTSGNVSPVNKIINYGTVETVLTGSNKCWITQNLGADHQAISATDATEESAGWYWQFNLKQGYMHNGTTRTPNSVWITSITENSDWLQANDPCTILLGTGWRMPTFTEWDNADANGVWNNYNNTYASLLKVHGAGYLEWSNGNLANRGVQGQYWSSSQGGNDAGYQLFVGNNYSNISNDYKAQGHSIRCLKNIIPESWSCGQPLIKFHDVGYVSPVNKAVEYGTVLTDLTGSNKCWITQNLGSDNQATYASDASEASAGWYWQFNRQQGFKHDGNIRTPNTWTYQVNGNSNWLLANDPCNLLLGTGWRLPTYTEWNNSDVNGGWNNYNQTFASVLKLHLAGTLRYDNGELWLRGTNAYYWSSTQLDFEYAWLFYFNNNGSMIGQSLKPIGTTVRCLKD